MNNVASKEYSSKSAAIRAMKNKVNIIHGGGQSGEVSFARLYVKGNTLYAESSYFVESTLQDYIDGAKKTLA